MLNAMWCAKRTQLNRPNPAQNADNPLLPDSTSGTPRSPRLNAEGEPGIALEIFIMYSINGQLIFTVIQKSTGQAEDVIVDGSAFDVECDLTDTDDDKRRLNLHLSYRGTAFDDAAEFTVKAFYDVFGSNIFDTWTRVGDITPGYTVSQVFDMFGDGLSAKAFPIRGDDL
jgi:hypothetical protein